MPATIAHEAIPFKACCGKLSYTIATLKEAIKCNFVPDLYDVELDGAKVPRILVLIGVQCGGRGGRFEDAVPEDALGVGEEHAAEGAQALGR